MSKKMKAEHTRIKASMSRIEGSYFLRVNDPSILARLTDEQVLSWAAGHLSKMTGLEIVGCSVNPGYELTSVNQRHFNFNFFNTKDSIANQELREAIATKVTPEYAGSYPEPFRYGVGRLGFYFVVGVVRRNAGAIQFTHIGHADRPSAFFRRIRPSRYMDPVIGDSRQSTHYIMPDFVDEYITRLV